MTPFELVFRAGNSLSLVEKIDLLRQWGIDCTNTDVVSKELKIRKMPRYNVQSSVAIVREFFELDDIVPDWYYHLADMTEHASEPHTLYENPNAASLSVLRRELIGFMCTYYRDDHLYEPFTWAPIGLVSGLRQYSVYYACVNFIDYTERLIVQFTGLPIGVVKALRNIQDRFQLLTLYMEHTQRYTDAELLGNFELPSATPSDNDDILCPLEVYGPRRQLTFDIGELPDLVTHTALCKFCGNTDEYPFTEPWHDFIVRRLNKALPFACKSRSVTDILTDSWAPLSELLSNTANSSAWPSGVSSYVNTDTEVDDKIRAPNRASETPAVSVKLKKLRKKRLCQRARTKKFHPSVTYNRNSTNNRDKPKFEGILEIIKRMVIASMLGVYDHCQRVPHYDVRKKVYERFFMNNMRLDLFDQWIKVNSRLVTYIIREYLYFCTAQLPGLEAYMRENYYWGILVDNAFSAMDTARVFMDESLVLHLQCADRTVPNDILRTNTFENYEGEHWHSNTVWDKTRLSVDFTHAYEPLKPWHRSLFSTFSRFNKENLDRAPRTMEINFVDKVFNVTYMLNDDKYSDEYARIDTIVSPEIQRLIKELIDVMCEADQLRELTFASLACNPVNLSGYAVSVLNKGQINYEMEESRSKIKKIMERIHDRSAYDYFVLHLFFYYWKDKRAITIVPTPVDMQRTLLRTLHRLYETAEGERLPDSAGLYYICPCCKQIKTNIFEFGTEKDKYRYTSYCSAGSCVDVVTGKIYCAKLSSKNNPKHRETTSDPVRNVGHDAKKQEKERKKKNRRDRKRVKNEQCPKTELIAVNMRDKMIVTETGIYLLCPLCATMTRMSKYNRLNPHGVFSCGCVNYNSKTIEQCQLCGKVCKAPVYLTVFDDNVNPALVCRAPDRFGPYDPQAPQRIRRVAVCLSHRTAWVKKDLQILCLSFIRYCVSENFTSYTSDHSTGQRRYVHPKRLSGTASQWDPIVRTNKRKFPTGEANIEFESLESIYDRVSSAKYVY